MSLALSICVLSSELTLSSDKLEETSKNSFCRSLLFVPTIIDHLFNQYFLSELKDYTCIYTTDVNRRLKKKSTTTQQVVIHSEKNHHIKPENPQI